MSDIPFVGDITRFFEEEAPKEVRHAIKQAGKKDILSGTYPYDRAMPKGDYKDRMEALQREMVKMLWSLKAKGQRLTVSVRRARCGWQGRRHRSDARKPEPAVGLCRGAAQTDGT